MSFPILLAFSVYWHLPIILVYSATRFEQWRSIFREAFRWGIRMIAFLIAIEAILFGLATFIQ
jgi:hypothetical protein